MDELFLAGIFLVICPAVINRERAEHLLAETAREVGVLMVVFAPLEAAFSEVSAGVGFVAITFLVGATLIAGGIIVEARK